MKHVSNPFEIIYGDSFQAEMASAKSKMLILLVKSLRDNFESRDDMCRAIGCSKSQLSGIMNGKLGTLSFEKIAGYLGSMGFNLHCDLDFTSGNYGYPVVKLEMK